MIKSVVLLCALLSLCVADCDVASFMNEKFSRCQELNQYYNVYWNVEDEDLHLALVLRTNQDGVSYKNGWVGFGVSVNGGMRGADIAIARFTNGAYVLEDRFVPGLEGEPKVDTYQNVELISATSDEISTIVMYKRKLKSCDVNEDIPILPDATQVIFAWGQTFGYHGQNRGSITINFHEVPVSKPLPEDAQALQLLMPNYVIPAQETTYVCTPLVLPADRKYHVVKWQPIITPGSEPYVHHMVIFGCPSVHPVNETYECGMSPRSCDSYMFAWSLGQPGNEWLDDFALPFGDGFGEYVYLQMHYNNPKLVANVADSSGLELIYTPTLRPYGILGTHHDCSK